MISVLDVIFKDFDDPEAMWILPNLASNRRGHNQLQVFVVPASGIPVIVTAKDFPDSSLMELGEHLFPERALYVEVLFWFIRILKKPRNVLEHKGVLGLFALGQLLV